MEGEGKEMEGPTYKGREGRGKREREGPPWLLRFPPGPRGARIVTEYNCYWQPTVCIKTVTAVNLIFINIRGNVVTITINILKLKYICKLQL